MLKRLIFEKKEAEKWKTFVDYLLNYYYHYYLLDLKEIELDLSKCLYLINNIICYCTLLKRWLVIYTLRSFLIIQFAKFDYISDIEKIFTLQISKFNTLNYGNNF